MKLVGWNKLLSYIVIEFEISMYKNDLQKALEAFLNPCLYGQRYTSFGRHFTKKDILIEATKITKLQ